MRYISKWYRRAYTALDAALRPLTPADGVKRIRRAAFDCYPFGPRQYWPYTQYCKARRVILYQLFPSLFPRPKEFNMPVRRAARDGPSGDVCGQMELFA